MILGDSMSYKKKYLFLTLQISIYIPKFTSIAKKARLTSKQLVKIIIGDGMTSQEKDLLVEMLYNREVVLIWDFTKIGKVKKEVVSTQKIYTIEHKA